MCELLVMYILHSPTIPRSFITKNEQTFRNVFKNNCFNKFFNKTLKIWIKYCWQSWNNILYDTLPIVPPNILFRKSFVLTHNIVDRLHFTQVKFEIYKLFRCFNTGKLVIKELVTKPFVLNSPNCWIALSALHGSSSVMWTRRFWLISRLSACREIPELAASEMMAMFWNRQTGNTMLLINMPKKKNIYIYIYIKYVNI